MADSTPPTSPPYDVTPPEDPVRKRRAQVAEDQVDGVTFTHKGMPKERLEALKQFLKHASADEIAAVRKMYGDMPEVLRMIGLEILPGSLNQSSI